ncbi:hypothetical protein NA56DRAFT_692412 [Hyaloscypha hepaticicola]|uniref:Uncharacterized protein n=1 Tax=Hyaloscypha hepaticicola TaxID=2082293 RepID=A0A2J6PRG8_9HELO|nr:hypothetical protein NA56DRAFT_692412 [Hyaloscypha hepaticicola]
MKVFYRSIVQLLSNQQSLLTRSCAFEKVRSEDSSFDETEIGDTDGLLNSQARANENGARFSCTNIRYLLFHGTLVTLYSVAFLLTWRQQTHALHCSKNTNIVYSPAEEAIRYRATTFDAALRIDSPFVGPPSPEVDAAWTELLSYTNIRVSGEDLRRINMSSIAVPGEEDSYWVALSAMHELHCVKRLRQYSYQDYYFPNLTAEEKRLNYLHNDHCLEIIRQGVMCRGDIALVPMHWQSSSPKPIADFSAPHKCVDWEALMEWSKPRFLDILRPNYLKHPVLGYSYPDGKSHAIGVADDPEYVAGQNQDNTAHQHTARSKVYPIIERLP